MKQLHLELIEALYHVKVSITDTTAVIGGAEGEDHHREREDFAPARPLEADRREVAIALPSRGLVLDDGVAAEAGPIAGELGDHGPPAWRGLALAADMVGIGGVRSGETEQGPLAVIGEVDGVESRSAERDRQLGCLKTVVESLRTILSCLS